MTSNWHREELARIGAETEAAARRTEPGACHPAGHFARGCLCPECPELRAAVGKGMDKHIAATMEAREKGKRAAEAEITAQAHREAAARAEVTRELAGYGAYPYRTGGKQLRGPKHEAATREQSRAAIVHLQLLKGPHGYKSQDTDPHSPCTCMHPRPGTSGVEDRPYAHDRACRRNYGQFSGTPGWRADHGELTSGIEVPPLDGAVTLIEGCRNPDSVSTCLPPADPVAQWQEVTRSLVLPDPGQAFTAIPDQPPGTCIICRTGPLFAGNQCWYCHALNGLIRDELRTSNHDHSGWAVMAALATALAALSVLYSLPVVFVPAFVLGLLAVLRRLP